MGVTWRIQGWKFHRKADSGPVRPIICEALEPRILLSAESLLDGAITGQDRNDLLDDMPKAVQYAELLESQECYLPSDNGTDLKPLFTINVDNDDPDS